MLIVDDSALIRKLLGEIFARAGGFEVRVARDGLAALEQNRSFAPDVVTLDLDMPRMDGLTCLDRLMVERPCPVVIVSSHSLPGAEATLKAFELGAVDVMPKPGGPVSLHMDEWAPRLVAKVRGAARAKVRSSLRLRERVRQRIGAALAAAPSAPARALRPMAEGDGLVLVGASTGGPPALEALLTALPASFPWPILVAQHMPASFTGALARRLDKLCALAVIEVREPVPLQPGMVYIGAGDADLLVSRRDAALVAMAAPPLPAHLWHPSADRLVASAMEELAPARIIGILMTGMGNDGAAAMAELHARGGHTIAEAEETAAVWGMPGELVKAGGAEWVEPLPDIAARLLAMVP
nr:chemotaxis-specific protein-glutamate methyltransferase CheB [Ancylobacter lacus]